MRLLNETSESLINEYSVRDWKIVCHAESTKPQLLCKLKGEELKGIQGAYSKGLSFKIRGNLSCIPNINESRLDRFEDALF